MDKDLSQSISSALEGLKVADFSWVGAGPRATRDLADHGALVVKIESSKRIDLTRLSPPFKDGIMDPNRSGFFAHSNTSKYSATLNLKHPKGIELAKRFVQWADVVVENFGQGAMDRMGLGYDDLKKIKDDIIMVSVSITGRSGPLADFVGYGNSAAALSGHAHLTGWPDRGPLIPPIAFGDVITPLFAVIAIMAALEHKRKTGKGQHIDLSQFETMCQFITPAFLDYSANGTVQMRMGNRHAWASPHGAFPCKGEDSWCTIAVFNEDQWVSLCNTIERTDLINDSRFRTLQDRKNNEEALESILADWTSTRPKEKVMERMLDAGVPAGAVRDAREVMECPQIRERELYIKREHPVIGLCTHPTPPMKLSDTPPRVRPAPCLGEHNHYVYTELLGMSDEEFVGLMNEGIFE
ncbi:MAG: CoA transferase [Deltaproteobacteria bacterium]|nr:CoA transferase [Deltaproteobacteria bacterium]